MKILSVSELNAQIKSLLEATFLQVSVSGEVSNFTHHSSGHLYFTLKDRDSSLKCVMFRGNTKNLKFQIQDGMNLTLQGAISVYPPRGDYQLNCISALPSGIGELTLAFEQLKELYQKKGYFENKKLLPKFPKKVALLTSNTGAVLYDMLKVAEKRWNLVEFILLNTLVQGDGAKESIAKNVQIADSLSADCIVLARGGGSLEDLWAFNEPLVIESIFNAKTPIVSAIGHEPDITLSDFVADLRSPTPSAAMEILLPDKNEWLMNLDAMQNTFNERFSRVIQRKFDSLQNSAFLFDKNSFFHRLDQTKQNLDNFHLLLEQKIQHKISLCALRLQNPNIKIHLAIKQLLAKKSIQLETLKIQLDSKNPKNYQRNGYACVLSNGKKIKCLAEISPHSLLELQDASAIIKAEVKEVVKQ
ncbi:exodeoxyribonuclease VII large subunit [uncultured Helicobacter sp.]|uniref:exodeoxyribonuclease VII large subunit n=1 Tax=uncultured Helicobacter sp. TaxID=175537 RepID=UPI002621E072|nr:exodeoxyribonuclease VII large subunit [uncultured Helicobacter sp.]